MNVLDLLEIEEGYSAKPYYCSEGYPTIGIGTKIGPKDAPLEYYDFTVSNGLAKVWLNEKVAEIKKELNQFSWFVDMPTDKQAVIISMAYQLGLWGLYKFKRMIAAIDLKHYDTAVYEALDSKWYEQTPERAKRHAKVLSGFSLDSVYFVENLKV